MNIRMKINRVAFVLLAVALLFGAISVVYAGEAARPKNVILFIGDGMGVTQITAGKIVKGNLNLEEFKVLGLLTTHSLKTLTTDSAAAGTALATGSKAYNGAISVSQDNEPLKTVVEYAKEKQKATGLVVSSSVTDATPAAFVAHVDSRRKETIIAEQITGSGVDVLFGGGLAYFLPQSTRGSKRNDEMNLMAELEKHMKVIRTAEEFQKLGDVDRVAGFFALRDMPRANERQPRLTEMTKKAIDILSKNQKGFFLMVEGSQIDWAAHKNIQDYLISEVIDFDDAVGIGLNFARKDGQTLVIVTSDHETGGFAIHDGSIKEKKITDSRFTGNRHTATMVPVFAYGPGCSVFAGIGDNTIVGKTIIEYLRESE